MKKLKLKNYLVFVGNSQVISLPVFLNDLFLHGKESRARTKFLKLLLEQNKYINEEKTKMIEGLCKKNDKGEPFFIYSEKKGDEMVEKETTDRKLGQKYAFLKPEDEEKFNKEWQDFMNEEFIVDILPSNSETIYTVRDLILNTTKEFQGNDAVLYSEWCDSFESISEEKENKKKK